MGNDPFLGESLQDQKYKPGQYYKEHCDFFHPHTKRVQSLLRVDGATDLDSNGVPK